MKARLFQLPLRTGGSCLEARDSFFVFPCTCIYRDFRFNVHATSAPYCLGQTAQFSRSKRCRERDAM